MPYAPGIQDRSGEILAGGINRGFDSLAATLDKLSQRWDEAAQLRAALGAPDDGSSGVPDLQRFLGAGGQVSDPGPAAMIADGSAQPDQAPDLQRFLDNGGQVSGPEPAPMITGSGSGDQEQQLKKAATATKALRDYGSAAHGYNKDYLQTLSLPQLQGLLRGTEFRSVLAERNQRMAASQQQMAKEAAGMESQQSVGRFARYVGNAMQQPASNAQMSDYYNPERYVNGAPGPDLNAAIFGGLRENPEAVSAPHLSEVLSTLEKYGDSQTFREAYKRAQVSHLNAETANLTDALHGGPDRAPKEFSVSGRKGAYNPRTGNFVFAPEDLQPAVDPNTGETIPNSFMVGNKMVTLPQANTRMPIETIADAEKIVQPLEKRLEQWKYMDQEHQKDPKNNPAPDPAVRQDLESRVKMVRSHLDAALAPTRPATSRAATVAQPRNRAEYDALPSGSLYVDPSTGKTYRKK